MTTKNKEHNFRSKFEESLASQLSKEKIEYEYESEKYSYVLVSNYTPDFILPNGIRIEAKGVLKPADRRKMKAIKEQHPELDIRFVFQNAKNKLNKNSKTTYGMWADKAGFLWSHKRIPDKWLK